MTKSYRDLRAWKAGKFQTKAPLSVGYKAVLDHEITRPPKFALRLLNRNWLLCLQTQIFMDTFFIFFLGLFYLTLSLPLTHIIFFLRWTMTWSFLHLLLGETPRFLFGVNSDLKFPHYSCLEKPLGFSLGWTVTWTFPIVSPSISSLLRTSH